MGEKRCYIKRWTAHSDAFEEKGSETFSAWFPSQSPPLSPTYHLRHRHRADNHLQKTSGHSRKSLRCSGGYYRSHAVQTFHWIDNGLVDHPRSRTWNLHIQSPRIAAAAGTVVAGVVAVAVAAAAMRGKGLSVVEHHTYQILGLTDLLVSLILLVLVRLIP